MHIGNLLRDIRMAKGLSQKDTAKKLNMSASTLSKYENNLRNPPNTFYPTFTEIMEVDYKWFWDQVGLSIVADSGEPYGEHENSEPWFQILPYQKWIKLNDEDIKTIKNFVEYTLSYKK